MRQNTGLKIFAVAIGISMLALAWVMADMGDSISTTLLVLGGGGLFALSQISPPAG